MGYECLGDIVAVDMAEAREIISKNLPGSKVVSVIDYEDKFLFVAHRNDPLEGTLDPFFSVDKSNGYFRDFSPQNYENPLEVINRLRAAEE